MKKVSNHEAIPEKISGTWNDDPDLPPPEGDGAPGRCSLVLFPEYFAILNPVTIGFQISHRLIHTSKMVLQLEHGAEFQPKKYYTFLLPTTIF